jgi:ribosomal protein S27AE
MTSPSTVEIERIECPNCGAGVDVSASMATGRIGCTTCGSILDRMSLEKIGEVVAGGYEALSNIQIGWTAQYRKQTWRVAGRVRYTYAGGYWDEWVMTSADGQVAYLEECEGEFRWFTAWTPRSAPTRQELEGSQSFLQIDGLRWVIRERNKATLAYFEGQLPWRATTGDIVDSLDIKSPVEEGAIEWTRRELEFYKAKTLTCARLFNVFKGHGFEGGPSFDDDDDDIEYTSDIGTGVQALFKFIIPALVIMFFIAPIFLNNCGSRGSYGGHYGGGGWSGK